MATAKTKVPVATVHATGERYLVRRRELPRGRVEPGDTRVILWGDIVGWKGAQAYCAEGGPPHSLRQVAVAELPAGPALWGELFEQTLRHRREDGRVLVETTPGRYLDLAATDVEKLRRTGRQLAAAAEADEPLAALLRLKIGL